jgi:hypothetical protein
MSVDPIAGKALAAGCSCPRPSSMGAMGAAPWVATPADVLAEKQRLAPAFDATNRDIQACGALTPGQRQAWASVYNGWLAVLAKPVQSAAQVWIAGALAIYQTQKDYTEVEGYGGQLATWQKAIRDASCTPSAPPEPVPPPSPTPEDLLGTVKVVAAAGVIIALVYGVTRIL